MKNVYIITTDKDRDLADSLEHASQLSKNTRTKNYRLEGLISKGVSSVASSSRAVRSTDRNGIFKGISPSAIAADTQSRMTQRAIANAHSKVLSAEKLAESAKSDLKNAKRLYELKTAILKKMWKEVDEAKANLDAAQKKYDSLKKAYETANRSYASLSTKK